MSSSILIKVVEEKILILSVMSRGTDSGKRVNNDFDSILLRSFDNVSETLISSKHRVYARSVYCCEWRGIILAILDVVRIFVKEWIVISLKSSHKVASCNTLPSEDWNFISNVLECSSLNELIKCLVNFGVLEIDLNLME